MKFGQFAGTAPASTGGDFGGDIWIRGFREPNTRVRFLEPTRCWRDSLWHYDDAAKMTYPCNGEDDCVGCQSDDEEISRKSRKYAANCLDESGRVCIYNIPSGQYAVFQGREQRLGSILDRDWNINKTGQRKQTKYDSDALNQYDIDADAMPAEVYNTTKIMADAYNKAHVYYMGEDWPALKAIYDEMGWSEPGDHTMVPYGFGWADTPAPKAAETKIAPVKQVVYSQDELAQLDVTSLNVDDLKGFLTQAGAEFPPRAPRARLVAIAQKWQEESQPEPPY